MAHPLKKIGHKRTEPKLGEPKLVHPDGAGTVNIAQELQGEKVADTLVRARQQYGQDLRSIAQVLCIRFSYLDSIERGQYENLPGATYAVGFVRSYAEYLGLDGDKIVERFKSEVEGLDSQTKLHFPTPAPEGKMPGGAVFLVAALLFAGAYGVWFYLSNQGETLADLVAPVPERLQGLVEGTPAAAPAESASLAAAQPAAEAAAPSSSQAPSPGVADAAAPAAALTTPTSVAEATPSGGSVVTGEAAPISAPAPVESATLAPADQAAATSAPAVPAPVVAPPPASTMGAPRMGSPTVGAAPAQNNFVPPPASASASPAAIAPPPAASEPAQSAPAQAAMAAPEAVPPNVVAPEAAGPENSGGDSSPAAATAGPSQSEPYAIPAAPDSAAATAFLINHEPRVYGEENAGARIVLKANQDAWVQVRDRQGTLLLTRVLRVGDSYMVPNEADLTLLTGNAGGLEVSVDGRALEPLGPVGAVRRNIPLDPEALINGAGRQP